MAELRRDRHAHIVGAVLACALAAPLPVAAQTTSRAPAPPLALVVPPPVPAFLPPSRHPPELTGISVDLERRGHQKKVTGATLMGIGSLVAASGLAVLLNGALDATNPRLCAGRCSGSDLVVAGSVGLAVGTAAAVTGVPIWLSGVSDARRALKLRDRLALPAPPGLQF